MALSAVGGSRCSSRGRVTVTRMDLDVDLVEVWHNISRMFYTNLEMRDATTILQAGSGAQQVRRS